MKFPRILKTTAIKLAFQYSLLYTSVLAIALLALSWSANRLIDHKLKSHLTQEFSRLIKYIDNNNPQSTVAFIEELETLDNENQQFYILLSADGAKIAGNLIEWPDENIELNSQIQNLWLDDDVIIGNQYEDNAYMAVIAHQFSDGSRLMLGYGVGYIEELQELTDYLLEGLGAALLLAFIISITLSNIILKRMDTISNTAAGIMHGDLSQRIPISKRNDEFDALANQLNGMLDRIQQLMNGMRQVTDNVAHDLRSPLTRLRNKIDVTLLEKRSETEYIHAMEQAIDDADSLIKTFNLILQISQVQAGSIRAEMEQVDISRILSETAELYRPAIEESTLQLFIEISNNLIVTGNKNLLAQAFGNLLDNAIKFTPANGHIHLKAFRHNNQIEVHVADSGPGVNVEDRQRVVERYVRLDAARTTDGNGLGLSLVDAIVRQHQATLMLENNAPGLLVIIRFPAAGNN